LLQPQSHAAAQRISDMVEHGFIDSKAHMKDAEILAEISTDLIRAKILASGVAAARE